MHWLFSSILILIFLLRFWRNRICPFFEKLTLFSNCFPNFIHVLFRSIDDIFRWMRNRRHSFQLNSFFRWNQMRRIILCLSSRILVWPEVWTNPHSIFHHNCDLLLSGSRSRTLFFSFQFSQFLIKVLPDFF